MDIALTKLKDVFPIEDIQAVIEQPEKEKLERQKHAHKQAKQEGELIADHPPGSGGPESRKKLLYVEAAGSSSFCEPAI